ncbi:hypothetical protein [Nocardia pneumoniae]|uniref:hypothetical protein n=1 Tax=Nocardia pneumoniae TaxID=228601 RepID=UPI000304FEAD|nr:hypothetical protein [Nocardia pneumoniae]
MAQRPADRYDSRGSLAAAAAGALTPPRRELVGIPDPHVWLLVLLVAAAAVLLLVTALVVALSVGGSTVAGKGIPSSTTQSASREPTAPSTAAASPALGRNADLVALFADSSR